MKRAGDSSLGRAANYFASVGTTRSGTGFSVPKGLKSSRTLSQRNRGLLSIALGGSKNSSVTF